MIGGYDMVFRGPLPDLERIRSFWPDAVIENADSQDIFIYESEAHRLSWNRDGATEENNSSLLYIIAVVVDGEGSPLADFVSEMFSG